MNTKIKLDKDGLISSQQTVRIYNRKLREKITEDILNSNCSSVNEYINFCVEQYLNSKIDFKKQVQNTNEVLEQNALIGKKFEEELVKTLKAISTKLNNAEFLQLKEMGLLRKFAFGYRIDENKYNNDEYNDTLPQKLKETYKSGQ